jgi:HK97 family phage portal protein
MADWWKPWRWVGAVRRDPASIQAASPENPSTNLANPDSWLLDAMGGGDTWAGVRVSEQSAMRSATVFRCVTLKSGVIAGLPLQVFQHTAGGRKLARDHRLYPLFQIEPNPVMSAFMWKEMIVADLMLTGNHYSRIERDNANRVVGLAPIQPQHVTPARVGRRNVYHVATRAGIETYDQSDIVHVPGCGFDGIRGISPIQWAGRQAIGLSLATMEFMGRTFSNGAHFTGIVTVPKGTGEEQFKRFKAQFGQRNIGLANAGGVFFGDDGTKFERLQMSLHDAQTLEAMKAGVVEIARMFGVPLHLIAETEKSTSWGTGIEQMTLGFQKFGLDPDLSRIEAELNRKLFKGTDFYCEFNRDALNAMDAKAQSELYAGAIQNAIMTPNEVRRLKNLPDDPAGDKLLIQGATVPLADAGEQPTSQPPERPAPPDPRMPRP